MAVPVTEDDLDSVTADAFGTAGSYRCTFHPDQLLEVPAALLQQTARTIGSKGEYPHLPELGHVHPRQRAEVYYQQPPDIRAYQRPDIDLSPPSFEQPYVHGWGSPSAALEHERRRTVMQPTERGRVSVPPAAIRRVVFADAGMSESNIPAWTAEDEAQPRVPLSTHRCDVPLQTLADDGIRTITANIRSSGHATTRYG